jgi:hypothetical protein
MIIKNSSVINRTYSDRNRHSTYVSGPDRADVQKVTGRTIQPVVIHDNNKPGQNLRNGQLQIYRPQVQRNDKNGRKPAPSRVINLKDVKRPSERNTGNPIPNVNPAINNKQKEQSVRQTTITPTKNNRQAEKPVQPSKVNPANNNRQKEQSVQPSKIKPENSNNNKNRPLQQPKATPLNNNKKEQQSRSVNPTQKSQQSQPRDVKPFNSKVKEKQSQNIAPNKKVQQPQPRYIKPSNSKGKEKQSHTIAPPNQNREAQHLQPNTNQDEKDKGKR